MNRLLLVDGHSNLYRAFYAIRGGLSAPDGTPTAAVYGFLRMQERMLRELEPSHVGVVFDVSGETFRNRMDERYKAQRAPMPEELAAQIPLTQEALRLQGLAVLGVEDVEADDVIATLAGAAAGSGVEVVIASADKDLMQLVRDPWVTMWHTRLERLLDEAGVEEVFGVPPDQVTEVLTLMGDTSDNIPGCRGIGEKGARELIRRWGTVDEIYRHLDEVTPPRARKALEEHREEVALSAELVRVRLDVEVPLNLSSLSRGEPEIQELAALYRRLGFTSMLADLGVERPAPVQAATESRSATLDQVVAALRAGEPLAVALGGGELALATGEGVLTCTASPVELAAALAPALGRLACHDAKALLATLRDAGTDPVAVPTDVMLAGYLLAPGEKVDLAALCQRQDVPPPREADGLAGRAAAILRLAPRLVERLEQEELASVLSDIELPLVPILEAMERTGIRLDASVLETLSQRLAESLDGLEREIHAEAGGAFNINSPAQLGEVLFSRRGLPVLRRTAKTKAPSTDADVLTELAARGYRLPALITEYREQGKLKSTYVDALPRQVAADGRVHTSFNQCVAATGRLSSSDPNLQNIPIRTELGREVRRAFVPEQGHVLLAADYSQIELRVLAHLCGDPALERAFAAGEDIHSATAALVFNVAPELVTGDQRRAAKTINFGLIYGMGAFALGRDLGIPMAEAQRFIDAYFQRLPRVREFMEATKEEARRTGRVRTLFGRVRWISGLDSRNQQVRGNAERMAMNAPIQGTAADLVKVAMIRLDAVVRERGLPIRLLLQVHDELVAEVPRGTEAEAEAVVHQVMEGAATLRVPLLVDVGHGSSWADVKG